MPFFGKRSNDDYGGFQTADDLMGDRGCKPKDQKY